jgi:hypothetical protein
MQPLQIGVGLRKNSLRGPALIVEKVFLPFLRPPSVVAGPGEGENENGNREQVGTLFGSIY